MGPPRDLFRVIGTVIDEKYRIDRVLGEGGFGVVYAGTHLILGQPIAIKCMKPIGETTEQEHHTVALFLREAKVLFALTHPGIVRLYDIGVIHLEFHQVPYVVLELIEGQSLGREIGGRVASPDQPHFTAQEIVGIFEPVLEALAFAHESGVAHRDLKPSNIILVPSGKGGRTAKIVDFGIARWTGDPKQPTGMTGFTPAYAAPEQWDDSLGPSGPASDVYSLAIVIQEACTLETSASGETPARIFAEVMNPARRIDLRAKRPDLPEALESVLIRATRMNVRDRYGNAGELLADFRDAFRGLAADGNSARSGAPLPAPTPHRSPALWTQSGPQPDTSGSRPRGGLSALVASNETAAPLSTTSGRDAARGASGRGAAPPRIALRIGAAAGVTMAIAAVVYRLTILGPGAPVAPPVTEATAAPPGVGPAPPPRDPSGEADITVLSLAAGSALTAAKAEEVAMAHKPELLGCYREALARDGALSGEVSLLLTVTPAGTVFVIRDMDEGNADLEAARDKALRLCIETAAARWIFPAHTKQDVAGALLTFQLHMGPPLGPPPAKVKKLEALRGAYRSVFILKSTNTTYPEAALVFEERGDRIVGEYPDGTMACNRDDDMLHCRWVQTDDSGGAELTRRRDGSLIGTWGYQASDSNAGTWKLTPKKR